MEAKDLGNFDVVVVGGGPGGSGAAIAASRNGASTLLVEREGCLGGGMTTMMVNPFMPHEARAAEGGQRKAVSAGIFKEVCDRIIERGQAQPGACIGFDDEYMKIVLDELTAEAGVKVLFHAALSGVTVEEGKVTKAMFAHNGGPLEVTGSVFIDGTGDGILAAMAGADFAFGDPETHEVMPMTTKFVVAGVDVEKAPSHGEYYKLCAKGGEDTPALINTNFSTLRVRPGGRVHFNAIRVPGNTIDPFDLSRVEAEGRRRVANFVEWLQANVPGYEKCWLDKMGAHVGVRESRCVVGDYTLTYDDWKSCARFDDAVACCSYCVDVHTAEQGKTRIEHYDKPEQYYHIPYRAITPKGLSNLLMACRAISGDRASHSSFRIMPTVMCIGQGAGTAAAMATEDGDVRKVDIAKLQDKLRSQGAVLEL